jgi:endonuclease III
MKNASKHAEELKSLLKKLVKDRPERPEMDPLVAIVRGTLSMDADDALVDEAMAKIESEFVDLNELRVATELEVIALIGEHHPKIEEKATIIRTTLHAVFDREQILKFDRVKELKKAEQRQFFRDMETMPPFVEAFVMLHAFDAPAVPVDDSILDLLIDEGVVEAETSLEEAQSFLEHQVKADDVYGGYLALREKALQHERKTPRKELAKKK